MQELCTDNTRIHTDSFLPSIICKGILALQSLQYKFVFDEGMGRLQIYPPKGTLQHFA